MKTYNCSGCVKGINMCERMPCRPTPDEAIKLMEAGYSERLIIETRYTSDDELVELLKPRGTEGDRGRCTFLTPDNLCEIEGLKPLEGRAACCKKPDDGYNVLAEITKMWVGREEIADRWTQR